MRVSGSPWASGVTGFFLFFFNIMYAFHTHRRVVEVGVRATAVMAVRSGSRSRGPRVGDGPAFLPRTAIRQNG